MLALIGGSGFTNNNLITDSEEIVMTTPYGSPSAPLVFGKLGGTPVVFLLRHGRAHEHAPHRVPSRANIWALRQAGAEGIIAVGTVGGIDPDLGPGAIAVPDQLIDCTWGREVTYYDDPAAGVKHVDMTNPFDEPLRKKLLAAAAAIGVKAKDGGVYVCTQGPRLETAAEVRRYQRDGGDMIGMTLYPECALARELGIPYAGICVSVNHAAGIGESKAGIDFDALKDIVERAVQGAAAVVCEAVKA